MSRFKDDLIQKLQDFALSSDEAKVYLRLLKEGTKGEFAGVIKNEFDEIGRTTLYAILKRLNKKGWIETVDIIPKRTKFVARPPFVVLQGYIGQKENELEKIKEKQLFIGDRLEKIYQEQEKGKQELTIETIHPTTKKYLRPLFENNWMVLSEVIEESEALERNVFDYELQGPKGFHRNAGLIIFEYNRNVENDTNLAQSALNLLKSKTEYELRTHGIPGFEDVKFVDEEIRTYIGSGVYLKFVGTDWVSSAKQVVIPIENRLFIIWAEEQNFDFLMEIILN